MGTTKKGADPSRAERKAKKRKLEDAVPDLPGDNENEISNEGEVKVERESKKLKTKDTGEEKSTKKEKKEKKVAEAPETEVVIEDQAEEKTLKKDKKKKSKFLDEEKATEATDVLADLMEDDDAPKKSKKERKAERKAKEAAEKAAAAPPQPTTTEPEDSATKSAEETKKKNNNRNRDKKRKEKALQKGGEGGKDSRFIVFIGNLPFSATTASVTKHFASIKPKSVRHLTQKDNPSKSKGIAFVEFDGYDHMKTCLKLFHHSMFDDGISPARKINVELTAGGGGNTKDRKAKIQEKNSKLNDQRTRRIQEEEKAKWEKKKDGALDESGIHPSRRARVPGSS